MTRHPGEGANSEDTRSAFAKLVQGDVPEWNEGAFSDSDPLGDEGETPGGSPRGQRQEEPGGFRLVVVRLAFLAVFFLNVQCALSFVLAPADFAAAYELSGVAGEAAVRGIGIAFLMWNATYPAFIVAPRRFSVLGWVIIAQQLIGLVGESLLLFSLPAGHEVLASSIERFIVFDAAGLVVMLIALVVAGFHRYAARR